MTAPMLVTSPNKPSEELSEAASATNRRCGSLTADLIESQTAKFMSEFPKYLCVFQAVNSAFSSVSKTDTRITNPALYATAAYAAPAYAAVSTA